MWCEPLKPQSHFRCRGELRFVSPERKTITAFVLINNIQHHGIAPCSLRRVAGVSLDTYVAVIVCPPARAFAHYLRICMDTFQGCAETRRHSKCYFKEAFNSPKTMCGIVFVELGGLEPPPTEPKSVVLPLHQSSICGSGGTRTRSPLIKSQVQCHFATDPMWAGKDLNLRTRMGADWQCGKLRISETSLFTLRFNV